LGLWAWAARRESRPSYESLAQRLYVDCRLEEMTAATLAAMREAARRASCAPIQQAFFEKIYIDEDDETRERSG